MLRGAGCWNQPVLRKLRGTIDGSGVTTLDAGETDPGVTIGTMSVGAANVTFAGQPKFVSLFSGHVFESAATRLQAGYRTGGAYDQSTGIIGIAFRRDDTGANENPANGETFELFFLVEEGAA